MIIETDVDVSDAAGLGQRVRTRTTIVLPRPEDLPDAPVVCFALPGAGYGRRYFTFDMPDGGGQAGWHAGRGWIFVAVDTLGVGEASLPDPARLDFRTVSAANHATARAVLDRLAEGGLAAGFPAIAAPVVLGLGQSMGGAMTLHQQAHHGTFDAIGVLGFSAVHTTARARPGAPPVPIPFLTRDTALGGPDPLTLERRQAAAVNAAVLALSAQAPYPNDLATPPGWSYHFDDVPTEIVARDLATEGELPPWRSATMPGLVHWVTAPGALAPEAAAIVAPVLAAFGERDVAEDPRFEAKAYRHAVDFSLFICPRMGHMHNFAGSRELLWSRIHHWGAHVAELNARLPDAWPRGLFSDSY
jgi:hypothetical protein